MVLHHQGQRKRAKRGGKAQNRKQKERPRPNKSCLLSKKDRECIELCVRFEQAARLCVYESDSEDNGSELNCGGMGEGTCDGTTSFDLHDDLSCLDDDSSMKSEGCIARLTRRAQIVLHVLPVL